MKESTDRALTNLTGILWIILGIVFIVLGAMSIFPMIVKAAYQNNIYDVREVERITDLQFEEKESSIFGVSCTELTYKRTTDTEYSDLAFFLFPNARSAGKALDRLAQKGYFYENSIVVTDHSVEGYLYGVCDAEVYEYYYRSGNLVIRAEASYGCFGTQEELDEWEELGRKQKERIDGLKEWLPTVFKTDK